MILYDVPRNVNTYLHAIGRSGRYGRKGVAINFVTTDDVGQMKEIEPNDQRPQKMKIGEALVGSVSSIEDQDNYSIEIQKPGRLSIDLSGGG